MKEKEIERLTKLKEIEKDLYGKGFKNICGIDEAGRGPLAGPVVVAGVIMPPDSMIEGVNDSKKVSEKKNVNNRSNSNGNYDDGNTCSCRGL